MDDIDRLLSLENYNRKVRLRNKPKGALDDVLVVGQSRLDPRTGRVTLSGRREHQKCVLDRETGEVQCSHPKNPPGDDCRQPWCLHRSVMINRTRQRLAVNGYAPGQKINGAVLFLRRAMEAATASVATKIMNHANRGKR